MIAKFQKMNNIHENEQRLTDTELEPAPNPQFHCNDEFCESISSEVNNVSTINIAQEDDWYEMRYDMLSIHYSPSTSMSSENDDMTENGEKIINTSSEWDIPPNQEVNLVRDDISEKTMSDDSSDWGMSETYSKWRRLKLIEESDSKDELNSSLSSDWGIGRLYNLSQSERDSEKVQDTDDIPSLTTENGVSHKQNINNSSESLPDISQNYPVVVNDMEIVENSLLTASDANNDEPIPSLSSDWGIEGLYNVSQSQRDSDKEQDEDDIPSLTPEKGVSQKQNNNDSSESLPDISSYPVLVNHTKIEKNENSLLTGSNADNDEETPSLSSDWGISQTSDAENSLIINEISGNNEEVLLDENELVSVLSPTISNFEIKSPEIEMMSDSENILPDEWFNSPVEVENNSQNDNIDEQWFDSPFPQEVAEDQ